MKQTLKPLRSVVLVIISMTAPVSLLAQTETSENPTSSVTLPGTGLTPEIPSDLFSGTVLQPGEFKPGQRTAIATKFLALVSSGTLDEAAGLLASDHLFQEIGTPGTNARGRDAVIKQLKQFRGAAGQSPIVPTRIIESRQIVAIQAIVRSGGPDRDLRQAAAVDVIFLFWVVDDVIHKTRAYLALDRLGGESSVPARPVSGAQTTPIVGGDPVTLDKNLIGQIYGNHGMGAVAAVATETGDERGPNFLAGPVVQEQMVSFARSFQGSRPDGPNYRVVVDRMYSAGNYVVSIARILADDRSQRGERRARRVAAIEAIGVTATEDSKSVDFQFYVDQRRIRGLLVK